MTNDNKNKVENDDELREKIIAKLEARQNEVIKKLLHLRDMLNNASGATVVGTGSSATGQLTESVVSLKTMVKVFLKNALDAQLKFLFVIFRRR